MTPDNKKIWKTTVRVSAEEITQQANAERAKEAEAKLNQNSQGKSLKKRRPAEFAGVSDADAESFANNGYGKSDPS